MSPNATTRFYRALLRLYPSSFRDEYRDELCRAFIEDARDRSAPAVFVTAIADVLPNAIAAHWDGLRHGDSGGRVLPTLGSDVRFALRQIRRAPLFSGVVIAVLALGIGINAGLLTTLHTYAWRPAPGISDDAQLARLTPVAASGRNNRMVDVRLSYPDLLDLRAQREVFRDVVAWESKWVAADLGGGAEIVSASYTSGNFFRVLGVVMAAGSGFPDDVDQTAAPIAVIEHSLWMTNFNGSVDAIGKTIRIMNQPFTIVGVAPQHFSGVDVMNMGRATIWIPLGTRAMLEPAARDNLVRRDAMSLESVARLAPGLNANDVDRRTAMLASRLAQQEPTEHLGLSLRAERLTGMRHARSDTQELVVAFVLVAALIVVITCTNVSALLLGRAVARRREIGVRLSLGATRIRIIRQMLTESLVLAVAGALLGLMLYSVTMKIAYATIPEVIYGLSPEPATFFYAAVFALATTVAFGLAPALHATKADIAAVMKDSGTHAIRRSRLQATFVVIQLACSQPVLVVTSLVLADMRHSMNDNADKAPASVVTMSSQLMRPASASAGATARNAQGVRDSVAAATRATLGLMRRRIENVPGVQSAAISMRGGIESREEYGRGNVIVRMETPLFNEIQIRQLDVTAGYFATLGIPILRGRAIGIDDDRRGSVAVVINEAAAHLLWPSEDPIGKRLTRHAPNNGGGGESTSLEVIGVVGTAPYSDDRDTPQVFAPISNGASVEEETTIAVRTRGDARAFMPAIRAAIREVEPLAAVANVATLAEQYAGRKREAVLSNAAAFAVGTVALVLASLGLYAIIAFAVVQRTREIGIRLAIGATSGEIVRHFFRDGIKVTAIALAIGLPVTVAGIRVVQANVLGFTVQNVLAVMLVVPVLIVIAALASWLPARRAGRVDPLIALRSE